ncbi:MAG: hypothetical protein Q8P51_01605 [Ignavibacteria bacterium]|nr:hypothetical protein [Ignavibacteria bacterium]
MTTDPEARLYREGPGKEATLSSMGHVLVENRHSLIVQTAFTHATETAECEVSISTFKRLQRGLNRWTLCRKNRRRTLGGDESHDNQDFVAILRDLVVTPDGAPDGANNGTSFVNARTTRHKGCQISQQNRYQVEESFSWLKVIAPCARSS